MDFVGHLTFLSVLLSEITCETQATSGDLDLYLNFDEPADVASATGECGQTVSSTEVCSVVDPGDATLLYITLVPFNGPVADAVVTCTSRMSMDIIDPGSAIELVDGVASAPFSLEIFEAQSFTLTISPDAGRVFCEVSLGEHRFTL